MIRRHSGPQTPLMGGMTEPQDNTSGRRAEAHGCGPCYWLQYVWGWDPGDLVCALSWLFTKNQGHGQHREGQCDEA
jgi:hypothetical protein